MERSHFPERLTTARLTLARHELVRAAQIFNLIDADRARLSEFLPWVAWTRSAEDESEYIATVREQWEQHQFFDYAMLDGDTYLGNIGVHSIDWHAGVAEIGFWILGEYEGRGFVTEAAGRLTDLCFARGFHRVEIRCDPANARSARVPERLGFTREALLRERGVDQFGRHHDVVVFARLRGDADRVDARRPDCVRHWGECARGPQSYYPGSLEVFGDVARLDADINNFEIEHHELPSGRRAWWPHALRDRDLVITVLGGRPHLWLNGARFALVTGDVVTLRAGTGDAHTLENDAPFAARLLIVRAAGTLGPAAFFPLNPELKALGDGWWDRESRVAKAITDLA